MNKRKYKLTLPTPERCKELGMRHEGMETRTRLWLLGMAAAVPVVSRTAKLDVYFTNGKYLLFHCNHMGLVQKIKDFCSGCTVEEVLPTLCLTNAETCERRGITVKL